MIVSVSQTAAVCQNAETNDGEAQSRVSAKDRKQIINLLKPGI